MNLKILFKSPPLFILLLLVSFASVSSVLFTPALPLIAEQFGMTTAQTQLTMTFFLVGYAIGNLFYAPFANRFGRKRALYLGILGAIAGSILILLSHWMGFQAFVIGRLILGLGSGVGMKIVYTMIGDLYQGEIARKKFSSMGLSFSLGPSIAFVLGGILTKYWGWESCYYFLIGYSFCLLFLSYLLPETAPTLDRHALEWKKIKSNYFRKFRNPQVITAALTMGTASSVIYIFASSAPFIGITTIGLTPEMFGIWSFLPTLGLLVGSFISHQLAEKKDVFSIFRLGIITILSVGCVMLGLFVGGWLNAATLFIPMPMIYAGLALIFPNASAVAMAHAQDKSNASAVINFINMGMACLMVSLMQLFPEKDPVILPVLILALGTLQIVWKNRLQKLIKPKQC